LIHKICIFASGNGSNAQKIIEYFTDNEYGTVDLIISDNPKAAVLQKASNAGVENKIITRTDLKNSSELINFLKARQTSLIVLAGFLKLIPRALVEAFPYRIINIHPALLPKYGGKGMYGHHVHQAVKDSKDIQTGITIHYVNEKYDDGKFIFQASCELYETDDIQLIAKKVQVLEHGYYPMVIEHVLRQLDL